MTKGILGSSSSVLVLLVGCLSASNDLFAGTAVGVPTEVFRCSSCTNLNNPSNEQGLDILGAAEKDDPNTDWDNILVEVIGGDLSYVIYKTDSHGIPYPSVYGKPGTGTPPPRGGGPSSGGFGGILSPDGGFCVETVSVNPDTGERLVDFTCYA